VRIFCRAHKFGYARRQTRVARLSRIVCRVHARVYRDYSVIANEEQSNEGEWLLVRDGIVAETLRSGVLAVLVDSKRLGVACLLLKQHIEQSGASNGSIHATDGAWISKQT
jgi:hypothetical protein